VPGAAHLESSYVYLLKGYGCEFYRFNPVSHEWTTLQDAPTGIKAKWDKGSFLVYDGNRYLYAHKAKYYDRSSSEPHHEMWKYDTEADSWLTENIGGMPLYGLHSGRIKKKKSKDGGCGVWLNSAIYALKGGNTQQFWSFLPSTGAWVELDTVPTNGSTGRKRRIKYGADMEILGGNIYALKGNKTREFWKYSVLGMDLVPGGRDGVAGRGQTATRRTSFTLYPNPVRDRVNLSYSLAGSRPVRLAVFDVTGRKKMTRLLLPGTRTLKLNTSRLSAGVYLAKLTQGSETLVRKLVVE
jgi:hypothetical protein